MSDTPQPPADIAEMQSPWIKGTRCPACKNETLFVANGGYITCSWHECPNPDYQAALTALCEKREAAVKRDLIESFEGLDLIGTLERINNMIRFVDRQKAALPTTQTESEGK